MRTSQCLGAAILLALVLFFTGCYQPGGPVPENPHPPSPRAWTPEEVDQVVVMEEEVIYSPVSRDNGTPRPECDYIHYLRFRLRTPDGVPVEPDVILVLTPGFLCGANVFEYLGRQVVYMAETTGRGKLEVWALERRPNTLEDLTGLNAAEATGDINTAVNYYYRGAMINGRKFGGFLKDQQVPFLSEFGLKQVMEDIYKVITTNVPDPETRRRKVFVGGHSLAGFITAIFAGWDFDGDPATTDDAGYRNCAGFVGLDTVISSTSELLEPILSMLPEWLYNALSCIMENSYRSLLQGIREGTAPRILPLPAITQEGLMLLELMGMPVNWDPDGESSFFKTVPYSQDVDFLIKLLHSRNLDHFLVHVPSIKDFRYTNEALLGALLDDNFMPITIIQNSIGFLSGGAVVKKDFPLPSDLANIPGLSELLGSLISFKDLFIANDAGPSYYQLGKGPLYKWANFDEVGDAGDPDYKDGTGAVTYTNIVEEVTDIQDLARTLYYGPSNFFEWYFTMRLVVDMLAVSFPFAPRYGLNFLHMDHVKDLPKIEFIAEKGAFTTLPGLEPGSYVLCKGYNHVDVLTAAADRPARRPSEVLPPLIDFLFSHCMGSRATQP